MFQLHLQCKEILFFKRSTLIEYRTFIRERDVELRRRTISRGKRNGTVSFDDASFNSSPTEILNSPFKSSSFTCVCVCVCEPLKGDRVATWRHMAWNSKWADRVHEYARDVDCYFANICPIQPSDSLLHLRSRNGAVSSNIVGAYFPRRLIKSLRRTGSRIKVV